MTTSLAATLPAKLDEASVNEPLIVALPLFNIAADVIEPPNSVDVPAIVIASSANLAIGISSLSISATMTLANPSVIASASNVLAFIVPLALMSPYTSNSFDGIA